MTTGLNASTRARLVAKLRYARHELLTLWTAKAPGEDRWSDAFDVLDEIVRELEPGEGER